VLVTIACRNSRYRWSWLKEFLRAGRVEIRRRGIRGLLRSPAALLGKNGTIIANNHPNGVHYTLDWPRAQDKSRAG
jgi:hypothetical protein